VRCTALPSILARLRYKYVINFPQVAGTDATWKNFCLFSSSGTQLNAMDIHPTQTPAATWNEPEQRVWWCTVTITVFRWVYRPIGLYWQTALVIHMK